MVLKGTGIDTVQKGPGMHCCRWIEGYSLACLLFSGSCQELVIILGVIGFGAGLVGVLLWHHLPVPGCWDGCDGVAFCLQGRFISCLLVVGSNGRILKSACNCYLGGTVSNVLKAGVGAISSSVGGAFWKFGCCLGGWGKSVCSIGRFGIRGRCMTGFGFGSSAMVDKVPSGGIPWILEGFLLSVMCQFNVPLVCKSNLTFFIGVAWYGWTVFWAKVLNIFFFSVNDLGMGEVVDVNVYSRTFRCLLLHWYIAPIEIVTI